MKKWFHAGMSNIANHFTMLLSEFFNTITNENNSVSSQTSCRATFELKKREYDICNIACIVSRSVWWGGRGNWGRFLSQSHSFHISSSFIAEKQLIHWKYFLLKRLCPPGMEAVIKGQKSMWKPHYFILGRRYV